MSSIKEKEKLYLEAKEKYYEGIPIMSDFEFDTLEEKLKKEKSKVIGIVGTGKAAKIPHTFQMGSLAKTNVYEDDISDAKDALADIRNFMNKIPSGTVKSYECTPKFDGNAMELLYVDGKFQLALTRGNGIEGFDQTVKLKTMVPDTILKYEDNKVEIRGEVVIPIKTFNRKYSVEALGAEKGFKNARNFVAGVLSREEYDPMILKDFFFVAYFMRMYRSTDDWYYPSHVLTELSKAGFNSEHPIFIRTFTTIEEFKGIYQEFKEYREGNSVMLLDGMVMTMPESVRKEMGENDHDPEWGYAVKFPPKEAITEIIDIDWNTGSTGEVVPTAIMKPVDLDGSTVQRATLFNAGKIKTMGAWPGAEVLIAKAGDIIPQIYKVITKSTVDGQYPTHCRTCDTILEEDGVHLWCRNNDCFAQVTSKIDAAIRIFEIEEIGKATIEKIYKAGIRRFQDYFDRDKFNETNLIRSGQFVRGRELEIKLTNVRKVREIELWKVIASMKLSDTGKSVSKQIAKYLSNVKHDFKSLNKNAVTKFTTVGTEERRKLNEFLKILNKAGIRVIKESNKTDNRPILVMTGKPPVIKDLKTKSDYSIIFSQKGFQEVGKLDESTKYLITDSVTSTSGKMKKAKTLNEKKGAGIEIMTYEDFYQKHVGKIPNSQKNLF